MKNRLQNFLFQDITTVPHLIEPGITI